VSLSTGGLGVKLEVCGGTKGSGGGVGVDGVSGKEDTSLINEDFESACLCNGGRPLLTFFVGYKLKRNG
jgi:hypothetical protein